MNKIYPEPDFIQSRDQKDKELILNMLEIDEHTYFNMQIEYGCQYLERILQQEPEAAQHLKTEPAYWEWWTKTWSRVDHQWLQRHKTASNAQKLMKKYRQAHQPDCLRVYPILLFRARPTLTCENSQKQNHK